EELFAQFHVLLKLAKAGKSGWKAFGLLLSAMFDPSGRLRVAAAAGDARRLNEVVDLMENGWRPLEGAMPWRHSQPCKFETLYLTPNIDLAPGLVLLNRDVIRASDEEGGTGDLLLGPYPVWRQDQLGGCTRSLGSFFPPHVSLQPGRHMRGL
ncbi:hypothetical protein HK405_010465, partial [Cladochytrium tenue]